MMHDDKHRKHDQRDANDVDDLVPKANIQTNMRSAIKHFVFVVFPVEQQQSLKIQQIS